MYTALYRKWRPMTFDDVVSQPHITATLSNQVKEGKTAHAYLFTGSRGTGKTTCARILAKAINCLDPKDGKPCLECEICRAADAGTLSDIIEIDAASNTGVDDIRELRDSAIYTPELCRYKVYIIDEVHMLSNAAFNALLKIMEEPPEHIKFILATTEVHKVPATIISRCQRFDFRRIREEDIVERLMHIAKCEKIELEREAAALIARLSDGAMRDALSLLDQCVAYSDKIDPDTVSDAAGVAGREYLFEILEAAADGDTPLAITTVDGLYSRSKDMALLCDELMTQTRNLMLIKTVPGKQELLNCLSGEADRLKAIADKLSLDGILSRLEILSDCAEALPRAVSKRTEFEMCIVRLCACPKSSSGGDTSALEKRIAYLESEIAALKAGGVQLKPQKPSPKKPEAEEAPPPEALPAASNEQESGSPKPFGEWERVLDKLTEINPGCAGALKGSSAYVSGDSLMILVQSQFFLGLFKRPENAASLKRAAFDVTGVNYKLRAKCRESGDVPEGDRQDPIESLIERAKSADIPVDIN